MRISFYLSIALLFVISLFSATWADARSFTLLTPRDRMATLVSFRIAGWPAEAALEELAARTFAIARTLPLVDAIRISVGFWTTEDELERFLDGVRLLAAHTPETIPPRRTLAMLGQP